MNNHKVSAGLLEEAKLILNKDLFSAFDAKNYSLVVRRAQEVVELIIKAFIKASGYEYPKVHDPGPLLTKICSEKHLDISSETLDRIQEISSSLAEERSPAFYAERSYTVDEAQEAKTQAHFVYNFLSSFVISLIEQTTKHRSSNEEIG